MSELQRDTISKALTGEAQIGTGTQQLGKLIAERLEDCGLLRTCLNCDSWNTDGSYGKPVCYDPKLPEGCKRFKMLPPPKVLVKGCDKHSDQIPF